MSTGASFPKMDAHVPYRKSQLGSSLNFNAWIDMLNHSQTSLGKHADAQPQPRQMCDLFDLKTKSPCESQGPIYWFWFMYGTSAGDGVPSCSYFAVKAAIACKYVIPARARVSNEVQTWYHASQMMSHLIPLWLMKHWDVCVLSMDHHICEFWVRAPSWRSDKRQEWCDSMNGVKLIQAGQNWFIECMYL